MLNQVQIIGRVGKDPEVRRTQAGDAVANISVATTKKWKDKGGQQQEHTEWHRVSYFGRIAEVVEKYVVKGSLIYVQGEMVTKKWTDASGVEKYSTEVRGGELKLLGGKGDTTTKQEYATKTPAPDLSDIDDDIPF